MDEVVEVEEDEVGMGPVSCILPIAAETDPGGWGDIGAGLAGEGPGGWWWSELIDSAVLKRFLKEILEGKLGPVNLRKLSPSGRLWRWNMVELGARKNTQGS